MLGQKKKANLGDNSSSSQDSVVLLSNEKLLFPLSIYAAFCHLWTSATPRISNLPVLNHVMGPSHVENFSLDCLCLILSSWFKDCLSELFVNVCTFLSIEDEVNRNNESLTKVFSNLPIAIITNL